MLPDNIHIVIVIVSIIDNNRLCLGRAICPQKYLFTLLCDYTPLNGCQMRSRCQGEYIDRYIHLFTYNIIAYCLWRMRAYKPLQKIKGGHGRPPHFCYSNPYQKTLPLSSIFVSHYHLLLLLMIIPICPNRTACNISPST